MAGKAVVGWGGGKEGRLRSVEMTGRDDARDGMQREWDDFQGYRRLACFGASYSARSSDVRLLRSADGWGEEVEVVG